MSPLSYDRENTTINGIQRMLSATNLASLPRDVLWIEILSKLDFLDALTVALASKDFYQQGCQYSFRFFGRDFTVRQECVDVVLDDIALGKNYRVKMLIQKDIRLLFAKGSTINLHGKQFNDVTPLQLAYGTDAVDIANFILKQLVKYYIELGQPYKWIDVVKNQLTEKFAPTRWVDVVKKQLHDNFANDRPTAYDFNDIVKVISKNQDVDEALEKFRHDCEDKNPILILILAYKTYLNHYLNWKQSQRDIFWQKVIGFLQKMLPMSYIQLLSTGLALVANQGHPIENSKRFLVDGKYRQFKDIEYRLGLDSAIYSRVLCEHGTQDAAEYHIMLLNKYLENHLAPMKNWLTPPLELYPLENILRAIDSLDECEWILFKDWATNLVNNHNQLSLLQMTIKVFYLYEENKHRWNDEQRCLFNREVFGSLAAPDWLKETLGIDADALVLRPSL